jgi:hypothetical protein
MDLNFFLCYMVDIQLLVCAWQLDSVVQLEHCTGIMGPQVTATCTRP